MRSSYNRALVWMIGFPLTLILIVSQFIFLTDTSVSKIAVSKDDKEAKPEAAYKERTEVSNCSTAKILEVKEKATSSSSTVEIDCNLVLTSTSVITKRMIFNGLSATGVTVDCNGATLDGGDGTLNYKKDMIEVKSNSYLVGNIRIWERPENITIKNCNITGSVRVWGMAKNGQGTEYNDGDANVNHYKNSSKTAGHTATARNNAPKNIVFDNITVTGVGRNPFYFAPGVNYSTLINSEIEGESDAVAIYLDAESYRNTIRSNYIHATTGSHWVRPDAPLIAIDGSSYNTFINNRFSALNNGGIFLYRNCGEGGVIRHATPSYNRIINNIFYYNKYLGLDPAVYLSSKNAEFTTTGGIFGFCGDDDGYPYGSSRSDLDYARYNVVMQNQIYKRLLSEMIRTKNPNVNKPNYVDYNETVTEATVKDRKAGCYVANGYETNFILHGKSIDVFKNSKGEPYCAGFNYTCNDGELGYTYTAKCKVTKVSFDCQVSGSNNGCSKVVSCPLGQRIIGATAAANLEFGSVSAAQLADVPINNLKVVKASDNVFQGSSNVGNTSVVYGQKSITGINGLQRVSVGCKEHDNNGGDCHIKGILYCYGVSEDIPIVKQGSFDLKQKEDN